MGLLIKPLNHISHYSSALKIWVKNVPQHHPDMENLRNAYLAIKKTSLFIQDSTRQASTKAKFAEVARRLIFKTPVEVRTEPH